MLSFLSLLLFAGVCLSVVSAELIPASTDPCNLNEDLTIDVRYPVEDPDDVRCGAERELEDVNGRDAPEVGIQMKDELEYLEDFLGMEGRGDDQEAFFFTLVMVDPDAPTDESDPMYFLHWLIVDIQGADFTNGHGREIRSYTAPSPPPGSGPHRYQFFAFKQPNGAFTDTIYGVPEGSRANFNLKLFLMENRLGAPEVGYQFLCENEEE
ncbi:protein D2-like [Asterias rubens]|uniref:protein D2-like n=1 Tax=Asterias rubens TaxID=7604 RepID=UPI001455BBD5|nr:protein D2-like [Asterias rubens]